jgi:hypothetical protein
MTTLRPPRPYSALDLPHPWRAATIFALLGSCALSLDAAPSLPWLVGVLAAVLFGLAGTVRVWSEHHELIVVRRSADRLIVHEPTSRDASELVRWRSAELTTRAQRDRLHREVVRTLRAVDPGRLPSASPLRRGNARRATPLLEQLAARLGDQRPVSARGIILARTLLCDAASPLYSDDPDQSLARAVRRVLGALEP